MNEVLDTVEVSTQLDTFEDHVIPEEGTTTTEPFIVDSLSKATWAMRRLRGVVAQIEANVEIAKAEQARIEAWQESVNKSLLNDRLYFETILTNYLREERKNDPSKKTVSTPYGKITSRMTQPKWEVAEQLTDWLLNHHDTLVRVKYEVDKSELKKTFPIEGTVAVNPMTGEVIPFITIIPSEVSYKVEVEL